MNTRNHRLKSMRAALVVGLGVAVVLPLGAQQGDTSQQNATSLNSVATPSPTVSPSSGRDTEHRKHQRRHRGKRRQGRARDQNRTKTRPHGQTRDQQQNGSGTEQRRPQEIDVTPAAPASEVKTAPENVVPQPEAVPQPTPQ